MFTKNQIDSWIQIGLQGDNANYKFHVAFKPKLVEAKMLIDRWGSPGTDIIFNSCHKSFVLDELKDEINISGGDLLERMKRVRKIISNVDAGLAKVFDMIDAIKYKDLSEEDNNFLSSVKTPESITVWGSKIHFVDCIPINTGLFLYLTNETINIMDDRSVAVFPM